jgi:peptidoglycan biosynthesis protein MviN/MurJ (putative lipid II flippase)
LGAGAFDWDATRLVAAALALFILSLGAQGISLLVARAYYASGRTRVPLMLGLLSVVVTTVSAVLLVYVFHASEFWRFFLEDLLRVTNINGTTVLMLALAYSIGALTQAFFGLLYFARDFSVSPTDISRLFFESLSAGVVGGACAYGILVVLGALLDLNTLLGIFTQGAIAGLGGLGVAALTLVLLNNREIIETYASLKSRLSEPTQVAFESTDVSS